MLPRALLAIMAFLEDTALLGVGPTRRNLGYWDIIEDIWDPISILVASLLPSHYLLL